MSSPDLFAPPPTYERFTRSDRVQHAVMVISFLVLTVTGLPQKYIYLNNRYLDDLIDLMGGIEAVRVVHRWAATVLMLVTVYHLLAAAHRVLVRRVSLSMLPRYQDVVDALQAVRYNLGLAKRAPPHRPLHLGGEGRVLVAPLGHGRDDRDRLHALEPDRHRPLPARRVHPGRAGRPRRARRSWPSWPCSSGTSTRCTCGTSTGRCSPAR